MRKYLIIIISAVLALVFYLMISANFPAEKKSISLEKRNIVWELYTDIFTNGGMIVYGTAISEFTKNYVELAQQIKSSFRMKNIKIAADSSLTGEDIKNYSLLILGTYNSNTLITRFRDNFPVYLSYNQFTFNEHRYNKKEDLITFIIPNPLNEKKFFLVHTGNDESYVTQKVKFELLNDLIITSNHQTLLTASLSYDKKGKWWIDDKNIRNYEEKFRLLKEDDNFRYVLKTDGKNKIDIDEISIRNRENLKKLKTFFNGRIIPEKILVNLYTNFEDKGLITLNTTLAHIDQNGKDVHIVVNDWISGNDFRAIAGVLLKKYLGNPKNKFLERGFAMYFSDNWREKGYKYWAARLYQSDNVPDLTILFDKNKSNYESDFIVDPLSGAFVDFIINELGKDDFISRYAEWEPDDDELNALKTKWFAYLQTLVDEYQNEIEKDRKNFNTDIPKFLKGFNFAHEGYDIHNGYLSRTAYQSLQKLVSLNVNAIAVNPFTSMRDEKKLEPLAFWRSPHTENDQSMIFLAHAGEKLGITIIMKPHIYLHRSWPGGIDMSSKEDWNKFIDGYYRWIRHYAIISEMYNIPILCVGNELSKATLQDEDKWIAMFDKLRRIYSGKLVYGANWGKEFENLTFWKHLDYIGISNYYPISKKDNPTDEELLEGVNRMLDKIEEVQKKYNKPIIFTEAGFRSSASPWQSTFEKDKKLQDTTYISQVRSYEVFYKAAYERDWLSGIFWWKWPSYLNEGGDPHHDLYTPNYKPTEDVVRKWYGKRWE
jgi:Glycoside Hydrolase Family 113